MGFPLEFPKEVIFCIFWLSYTYSFLFQTARSNGRNFFHYFHLSPLKVSIFLSNSELALYDVIQDSLGFGMLALDSVRRFPRIVITRLLQPAIRVRTPPMPLIVKSLPTSRKPFILIEHRHILLTLYSLRHTFFFYCLFSGSFKLFSAWRCRGWKRKNSHWRKFFEPVVAERRYCCD